MIRLGILGSTRGTNLLAIARAIQYQPRSAHIAIVISNKANAMILEHAASHGLKTSFLDPQGLTREAYDAIVSAALREAKVDWVLLLGYMRILSPAFIEHWRNRIINVHPSLLPAFAGKMDLAVHEAVLAAKAAETGCTVHYVTEEVDNGPILLQKKCRVLASDTPITLKARVQSLEAAALIEVITQLMVNSPHNQDQVQ